MKKRTVITTEKHEVWVIRQPGEVFAQEDVEDQEPLAGESLSAPSEYEQGRGNLMRKRITEEITEGE